MKNITITFTKKEALTLIAILLSAFMELMIKSTDRKITDEIKALLSKVTSALNDKKTTGAEK